MALPTAQSLLILGLLGFGFTDAFCKSVPGSPGWPSRAEWQIFNKSLSYQLLKPLPPAAPCHANEPNFNNLTCAAIEVQWSTGAFHANDPISTDSNNFNSDSCLPDPTAPCSGEGYPIYVVNATNAEQVKTGVDFARKHNIRLVVKGTGHDYLGRSVAPNSLSIWTHHLRGIQFCESFRPKGCQPAVANPAVTIAAGEVWGDIYQQAGLLNLTVVGAVPKSVGVGGYLTGGGHSPITGLYGTGSDQVLEIEVVTASGDILTVNECQNTDLFWALRGGGGSTFAVITAVTIKTFPTMPIPYLNVTISAAANSEAYWAAAAYLLKQYPSLVNSGVFGYVITGGSFPISSSSFAASYIGYFLAPNKPLSVLVGALTPLFEHINATWPGQFTILFDTYSYPDFYSWWISAFPSSDFGVGLDGLVANRFLDANALSAPQETWVQALKEITPPGAYVDINVIAGPGVWHAVPSGGSDSIHPGWRKAYVEFVTPSNWPPLNATAKEQGESKLIHQYTPPLDKLAGPNAGCYINEANPLEPNLPDVFWGSNYPRLLAIKKAVDPDDVFWCHACVGREGWVEVGDKLCRV